MERLEPFVGEWMVEASLEMLGSGITTFEWVLDGQFLIWRSVIPDPVPNSISVIGFDPEAESYTQHYFDSRGVVRTYAMELTGDTWTLLREAPDFSPLDFHQRFKGTFSEDRNRITGAWEKSDDGSEWTKDFDLEYARTAAPGVTPQGNG